MITLSLKEQDCEPGNLPWFKATSGTVDTTNADQFGAGSSSDNNSCSHYFSTGQSEYIFLEAVTEDYSDTSEIYFSSITPTHEHCTRACIFLATIQGTGYDMHTQETISRGEDLLIPFNFFRMLLVPFLEGRLTQGEMGLDPEARLFCGGIYCKEYVALWQHIHRASPV